MKYFSMFSGIGGFELGIQRAHNNKQLTEIEQDGERRNGDFNEQEVLLRPSKNTPLCVGYSEIDKYSIQTYNKNFRGHKNYGSATEINPTDLPDFDMLCGGFPCQAFSIAGKRRGFEDTRGTLFFDIARILKVKRPKIVFLENVKGLLNHEKGRTFSKIIQTLDELGYETQWVVLNSKFFGVPQNRERVFIIGSVRGTSRPEILPFRESNRKTNAGGDEKCFGTLTASMFKQNWQTPCIKYVKKDKTQHSRVYEIEGISPTLAGASKLSGDCTPKIRAVLTPDRLEKRQNGRRFKEEGEPSFTLTGQDKHGVMVGATIRRLTPTECERLQGFPELESFINFNIHQDTICLDLQKSYVNVEIKNPKLQNVVGDVEKNNLKENASFVEQNLNIKNQQISKLVQKNVRINCVEGKVQINNQGKQSLFVNYVQDQNSFHPPMEEETFAQLLAGINITLRNVIISGKEVSLQNEQYLIQVKNGKMSVKLFGKEIMQLVRDVKIDSTTLKEHLKFITLNPLNLENIDWNWTTSFFYVISVIIGFIQTKMNQSNSLSLEISNKEGYTYGVSDTQRYKQLGNAVTVNVIQAIMERLIFSIENNSR